MDQIIFLYHLFIIKTSKGHSGKYPFSTNISWKKVQIILLASQVEIRHYERTDLAAKTKCKETKSKK